MANKRDPRKVTVTDEVTLLSDLRTRRSIVFSNDGSPIGLHHIDDFEFADGFPLADGAVWNDADSSDQYYAICDTGQTSDVWVWEME